MTDARPDPVAGPWILDEDLIAAARSSGRPQSAVYPHPEICTVIGNGGDPWVETRPDAMAADGVPLLRRRGGGCAVVVDPGNVICSLVLPVPGIGLITRGFDVISSAMGVALAELGLPGVAQRGTSDLTVGERKIGGSCIWRTRNLLYYSTTLLVAPDWDRIDRYLPHPPREPDYRAGRAHREFLTSLRELGDPRAPSDLAADLQRALPPLNGVVDAISG
jgi:lipoate-protein ligase A